MKRILMSALIVTFVSGCASQHAPLQMMVEGRQVVSRPIVIRVPNHKPTFHLAYGNEPALEQAFNQYAKTGKAANIITEGFVKFAYNAGQQPIVKATPFQETVISLQPGERFTNISSGDPERWSYTVATSGSGALQQQNVLVKPARPNVSTNLVITTDRHIYNVKLLSSMNPSFTRQISFWYPEEMVNAFNETSMREETGRIASVPDINLHQLNFNYTSSCGFLHRKPNWAPVRIFDDGIHTYIQFPVEIANRDMPALFTMDGHSKELVNYRYKAPYFIVDKIFTRAVLVMGVGRGQQSLTITNHCSV